MIDLDQLSELDFRHARRLADVLNTLPKSGLDHAYAVARGAATILSLPSTNRSLVVTSDIPALQVYTSGHLNGGPSRPDGGAPYGAFEAIALEPEEFPDAPNCPHLPSAIVRPGQTYRRRTTYTLTV